MSQLFNYAAITGFCTLIVEAIILLFRSETVERIMLNERKKRLIDFAKAMILGFSISLILYSYLEKDSSMVNIYGYGFTFVMSLFLSVAMYHITIWIMKDIGFGKSYFIEDEQHGKLYLIKNSNEKYILLNEKYLLLADRPKIKDSKFVLFKDGAVIVNKKIYSEPKKLEE